MSKICPWCGEELKQIDIIQRDADNRYWHCMCADKALAEIAREKGEKQNV